MGISTPGIGSGLDINGIVSKLMAVEAQPLRVFDSRTASFQSKISALGTMSGAVSTFQSVLSGMSSLSNFTTTKATSADTSVMVGSATSKASAGIYDINVTQTAQAQTLASNGLASTTTAIGLGNATTLTFQLGTVSGGSFGLTGSALSAGVSASGIANGSLSINGTAIATDAATRSAKALAEAINAKNASTGVSAVAQPASSSASLFGAAGATSFGQIDTSAGGTYSLSVNGIEIASQGTGVAAGLSAADIDTALSGNNSVTAALSAANISFTGSAADGTLVFTSADGANLTVSESVTDTVKGGIGKDNLTANNGSGVTTTSGVTLSASSGSPITVAGNAPALAGLVAGTGGAYSGATFTQEAGRISGSVVIDNTNNTLQGIRDAINKANLGVTATIVSDGSATPNRLILASSKTGAASTIKLDVTGVGAGLPETALSDLLAYDPAGVQKLSQNSAGQDTTLKVNGVPITSATNSISEAIQGVTLTVGRVGRANLVIERDTASVTTSVNNFVKAYNDLNAAIKEASGYNAETKAAGALLGDPAVRALQAQVRRQLGTPISGLSGSLTNLSQVGITFQKDGRLSLDSSKLGTAIKDNFEDLAGLFAVVGKVSDTLVEFKSSTSKTVAGSYALNITQVASQGALKGDLVLANATTIASDTSWTVTIDDTVPPTTARTATVSLSAGTYTNAQLATLIQSAVNGSTGFQSAGLAVKVTAGDDGKMTIASAKYGSTSNLVVSDKSGTALATIFGTGATSVGVDVAGTIGGMGASGVGQTLTGLDGTSVAGLKIDITGGAIGERGTVGFSQGYAYQLNNITSNFLGASGLFAAETKGMTASMNDISKQKAAFADKLIGIEKRYRAQYTALDVAISSMSATSSFLTQQFAALTKQNN